VVSDTAADRATLAEIRADYPNWRGRLLDLLRMAEDGIAAREAIARVEALHQPEPFLRQTLALHGGLATHCARCPTAIHPCATRRAITGEASPCAMWGHAWRNDGAIPLVCDTCGAITGEA